MPLPSACLSGTGNMVFLYVIKVARKNRQFPEKNVRLLFYLY